MKYCLLFILVFTGLGVDAKDAHEKIHWREFDKSSFELAKQQNKFIILDLVAVWCHWCHVMDKTTYSDSKVIDLLNKHFITT
jgi:uncharacterized protein YyaL (SSP411 family)